MPTLAEILEKKSQSKAAPPPAGLKITPETDKAALAATIKQTLDATAPKIHPPACEPRELGAMEPGERIPMDHPDDTDDAKARAWFTACHSFESEMGVLIEPGETAKHAWLAVASSSHPSPILLLRLPLLNRQASKHDPF
jgi:hypothetical protein